MNEDGGYVDLQVNGYVGADFTGDGLMHEVALNACQQLRDEGVDGILATVITDDLDAMCRRLSRIVELRDTDPLIKSMIWGIHIEGPFLNEQPGFIGAHPSRAARPADAEAMHRLLEAAGGLTRIVTLAPERDQDQRVTRLLARQHILVSAGHCDPSLDDLRAAVDAGLTMFTHLGNGCPLMMHRHDNVIQRALSLSEHLWIGFIADGVHIPYFALENYLRCAGRDRCFLVTDAISAAGLGPGRFTLGDQRVLVDENLATWSEDKSHLMGSAITMSKVVANLRDERGMDEQQIRQLVTENPRRILASAT